MKKYYQKPEFELVSLGMLENITEDDTELGVGSNPFIEMALKEEAEAANSDNQDFINPIYREGAGKFLRLRFCIKSCFQLTLFIKKYIIILIMH